VFASKVCDFAGVDIDIEIRRLAVTPEQTEFYGLPTRPTKTTDSRSRNFVGRSVEVDAVPASELRRILRDFIAQFIDEHALAVLQESERSERQVLRRMAGMSWT
jgi:hypothetical protein